MVSKSDVRKSLVKIYEDFQFSDVKDVLIRLDESMLTISQDIEELHKNCLKEVFDIESKYNSMIRDKFWDFETYFICKEMFRLDDGDPKYFVGSYKDKFDLLSSKYDFDDFRTRFISEVTDEAVKV